MSTQNCISGFTARSSKRVPSTNWQIGYRQSSPSESGTNKAGLNNRTGDRLVIPVTRGSTPVWSIRNGHRVQISPPLPLSLVEPKIHPRTPQYHPSITCPPHRLKHFYQQITLQMAISISWVIILDYYCLLLINNFWLSMSLSLLLKLSH